MKKERIGGLLEYWTWCGSSVAGEQFRCTAAGTSARPSDRRLDTPSTEHSMYHNNLHRNRWQLNTSDIRCTWLAYWV